MKVSSRSIEKIVNDSVSDITTTILLFTENSVIKELISNCNSETKKALISAITELAGEAAYQGIVVGLRIYTEVVSEKNSYLKATNH